MAAQGIGIVGSWLVTGDADVAPIPAGGVVLDEQGAVLDLGPEAALRDRHPSLRFEKHAAVLTPGLVNAHTHLELSGLRGRVPGGRGFAPWVDTLVTLRAQTKPELDSEAIDLGVSELLGYGVVAVGEVCNQLHSCDVLSGLPLCVSVFHEVFGMRSETAQVMQGLAEQERAARTSFPPHMRYALAPHTTHTLHPAALQALVARAAESGVRTSLHLAEHAAERAFLASGEGPFADWVKARGSSEIDWQIPALDPVRYADKLGLLGPQLIAVHLADARPDELALLAERKVQAVLCPRSNLFIEVKLPPLLDILRAGLKPGLGTDSLASNTSLDPLAEARALRKRFPTVPALTLLAMATSWGADALGYGSVLGRIARGRYPGVLAFEHTASAPSDPASFVLDHENARRSVLSRPKYPALASLLHEVSP
jgi:cytosine/adenosine deaminase-related metal-dependent hydrolase